MNSLRRAGSLLAAAVAGVAVFIVCFLAASRYRQSAGAAAGDELAWVCREFQLSEAETKQLRALHAGYRPECEAMCRRIDAKNRELEGLLARSSQVGPEIERVLRERAALGAECQARMLQHFQAVAATMPGERGTRYLAEMHRLILGLHAPDGSGSGAAVLHESH
ncbi:MAG: periplasmic heavy metal sensor [Verrucomicrobiota bacterium]